MKERPGVMIYLDILPSLEHMTTEEIGLLFEGILMYGKYGQLPNFSGAAAVLWPMIRQRLDRDLEKCQKATLRRQYAAYSRWKKAEGEVPEPFSQWLKTMETPDPDLVLDTGCCSILPDAI